MGTLFDRLNPFHTFERVLERDLTTEATRMAAAPTATEEHQDRAPAPTPATNGEVVTGSGAIKKVNQIVAAAEGKVIKDQAEFNARRDAAEEGRRKHEAVGLVRVPVPTGRKKVHREAATVVAGDSVIAGEAGVQADRLRAEVAAETRKGWIAHLVAQSLVMRRIGIIGLTFDVGSLLFLLFRTLNVGLTSSAFQRDPAGQLFGVVMSIGFATIAALTMFFLTRLAGGLTWRVRNAERGDQVDPKVTRRSRLAWLPAGVSWTLLLLLLPLVGMAVAQRLAQENEAAGSGSHSALALLLAVVFGVGPVAFALGESFAASAKMQRVAALGTIASALSATREALARQVLASDNAADQVERRARTTVAVARREAVLARLAADQLIWGTRARHGHMGDLAAPIVLPTAAKGQLLPDVTFDGAFAALEEILKRMEQRPAGDVPTAEEPPVAGKSPAAQDQSPVHLAKVQEPDAEERAA